MKVPNCCLGIVLLLASGTSATAGPASYRVWAESLLQNEIWTVAPHVAGPAGSILRYQIVATKSGRSGRSDTRQSGTVAVGADGSRLLSTLRIGVGAGAACEINVKVFDGSTPVADLVLRSPT